MTGIGPSSPAYDECSTTMPGVGGVRLLRHSWRAREPRAVLLIAHGLGEHSGRYQPLLGALENHGVSVESQDHRGHGRSEGPRGHVDRFGDYVADWRQLVDAVRSEQPGVPVFVLGHSLGGVIAARHALDYPAGLSGIVLSSPAFSPGIPVPAWKEHAARWGSRWWPRLTLRSGISCAALSHDPSVQAAHRADPLVHDLVSVRWYTEFRAAAESCLADARRLELPLFAFHGTLDSIASSAGTERFVELARSVDKTLQLFSGFYHETMNELGRDAVLAQVVAWVDRHTAR